MQSIHLPDDQFKQLAALAEAAGYQDVPAFIASFVNEPTEDPRRELTDAQLRKNVAEIEHEEAQIDTVGGRNLKDAIVDIANKYDLDITQ